MGAGYIHDIQKNVNKYGGYIKAQEKTQHLFMKVKTKSYNP